MCQTEGLELGENWRVSGRTEASVRWKQLSVKLRARTEVEDQRRDDQSEVTSIGFAVKPAMSNTTRNEALVSVVPVKKTKAKAVDCRRLSYGLV